MFSFWELLSTEPDGEKPVSRVTIGICYGYLAGSAHLAFEEHCEHDTSARGGRLDRKSTVFVLKCIAAAKDEAIDSIARSAPGRLFPLCPE